MTVTMAIYAQDAPLLNSLRSALLRAGGGAHVEVLIDPSAERVRDSGVWEFLGVACGTGGAVTVAIRTIGQWIASTTTTVRLKIGQDEFVITSRNADVLLPKVAEVMDAARRGLPGDGEPTDER